MVQPRPFDIIAGKSPRARFSHGNDRMHRIAGPWKNIYQKIPRHGTVAKNDVLLTVLQVIMDPRDVLQVQQDIAFLTEDSAAPGGWSEMTQDKVLKKVQHVLRDQTAADRRQAAAASARVLFRPRAGTMDHQSGLRSEPFLRTVDALGSDYANVPTGRGHVAQAGGAPHGETLHPLAIMHTISNDMEDTTKKDVRANLDSVAESVDPTFGGNKLPRPNMPAYRTPQGSQCASLPFEQIHITTGTGTSTDYPTPLRPILKRKLRYSRGATASCTAKDDSFGGQLVASSDLTQEEEQEAELSSYVYVGSQVGRIPAKTCDEWKDQKIRAFKAGGSRLLALRNLFPAGDVSWWSSNIG